MADEAGETRSARSRFLSKSKWGKVFKESDAPPSPGHTNSFKLNEDVVDFLKPSTDKGPLPKINIAVASRWPTAHEVRQASENNTPTQPHNGYRKPKRRPGLAVAFAKTAPEVMGEGGDDASDPPSEISRQKAMMSRSVSARVPHTMVDGSQVLGQQPLRHPRTPNWPEAEFRPQPVRRTQTSQFELSPPAQRKLASSPLHPPPHARPSVSRMPTGFNSQEEGLEHASIPATPVFEDEAHLMPRARPSIKTKVHEVKVRPRYDSAGGLLSVSPRDPVVRRHRDMQASEGMVLRRASALYHDEEKDSPIGQDADPGFRPSAQYYSALSDPSASKQLPDASMEAEMTLSPVSGPWSGDWSDRSTFADPDYAHQQAPSQPAAAQSLRQARPDFQPSYMKASVPVLSQPEPPLSASSRFDPSRKLALRPVRDAEQPSYMRSAHQAQAPQHANGMGAGPTHEQTGHMRAPQSSNSGLGLSHSRNISVPEDSSRSRSRSPLLDRFHDPQAIPHNSSPIRSRREGSGGSINRFPSSPSAGHTRNRSGDFVPTHTRAPSGSTSQQPRIQTHSRSPPALSPRSSIYGAEAVSKPALSPYAHSRRSIDYFSNQKAAPGQTVRSPAVQLRYEEAVRAPSPTIHRPLPSPFPTHGDAGVDLALAEFAARVAHTRGVFRLTAERERPAEKCTPDAWLRAGLWWYLRGKTGLEALMQLRAKGQAPHQESLQQPHVDLAKAWWILSEPLEAYDMLNDVSPQSAHSDAYAERVLVPSVALLRNYIKSLSTSMMKSQLLPPQQSLIQGQSTDIWLLYPRFAPDAAAVLNGSAGRPPSADSTAFASTPLEALPLGDTRDTFSYSRFQVEFSLNTDEADTDRVALPCMLSVLRLKRDYRTTIVISSQDGLVNVKVGPRHDDGKGLTWHDVVWKASAQSMIIHLPRGFDLTVRMQERDYRALWNLTEYSRKVELSFRPEPGERMVHEVRLAELQYAESGTAHTFPQEKMKGCSALVFERTVEHRDGSGAHKMHRGYRLLLVTDSGHKSLSHVSHKFGLRSPLLFEFLTDAAANGTTAMVLRVLEENRQCRILLVFPDLASRQGLFDMLNGLSVGPDEEIVGKMAVTAMHIQAASQPEGLPASVLQTMQWQKLGITNHSVDQGARTAPTVQSDNLRILARHAAGCVTDRLNLGKGELLFRLPCADTPTPVIQVFRNPQEDISMSIDTRQCPQQIIDGIADLLALTQQQATIRTVTFATAADLHAFQAAITGFTVRYDGVASTFGISRRMMVVPIYHKLQASTVRLQVLTQSGVTQVLAFMEEFSHANAFCIQVKSTDTFENVKGDAKGKKWAVRMVDAKFSLPKGEKEEMDVEERVRRRFINLEGLDYAEEHDDITVGFDTEEGKSSPSLSGRRFSCAQLADSSPDRNRFAQTLPAAATIARGLTLKRRI